MAHFAQLDENNIVIQVIVVDNENTLDAQENESGVIGVQFCKDVFGEDTIWMQTSYNANSRKAMAVPEGTYDANADEFVDPSPFPSWSLDANNDWQAPTGYPENGNTYSWNEETLSWDLTEAHQAKILVAVDGEVVNP
jgi:hypothetical protein